MRITTRLGSSFGLLLLTIAVVGAVAVGALTRTARTLSTSLGRAFATAAALEAVADLSRDYSVAASGMAASGAVTDESSIALDRLEAAMASKLQQLGAIAPTEMAAAKSAVNAGVRDVRTILRPFASGTADATPASGGGSRDARLEEIQLRLLQLQAGRRAALQIGDAHARTTQALAELRAAQQRSLDHALGAARSQVLWLTAFVVLVILAAGGGLVLVYRGVQRGVLNPLRQLAESAHLVSERFDLSFEVAASGDAEVQHLGRAFGKMVEKLRDVVTHTQGALKRLLSSAQELEALTQAQQSNLAKQASALEEARRTSAMAHEAARSAGQQAGAVLRVAERAEELGREGDQALAHNASAAMASEARTRQLIERIVELVGKAQRIAAITDTVRDLAQQSHVVALNASIQASGSGHTGQGFGVVAAEMRSLADRSVAATVDVRSALTEVVRTIRQAAGLVEETSGSLQEGTSRTRRLGECVSGLTGIVRENLSAVRQIEGMVTTQGAGLAQISSAVEDLSSMMVETVHGGTTTGDSAAVLREVASEVTSAIQVFKV